MIPSSSSIHPDSKSTIRRDRGLSRAQQAVPEPRLRLRRPRDPGPADQSVPRGGDSLVLRPAQGLLGVSGRAGLLGGLSLDRSARTTRWTLDHRPDALLLRRGSRAGEVSPGGGRAGGPGPRRLPGNAKRGGRALPGAALSRGGRHPHRRPGPVSGPGDRQRLQPGPHVRQPGRWGIGRPGAGGGLRTGDLLFEVGFSGRGLGFVGRRRRLPAGRRPERRSSSPKRRARAS